MPGLEDAREGQIAVLPRHAAEMARVGLERRVAGLAEVGLVGPGDREGGEFTAEPVAGVVPVAVHKGDFDAAGEDVGEGGEEGAAGSVWGCGGLVIFPKNYGFGASWKLAQVTSSRWLLVWGSDVGVLRVLRADLSGGLLTRRQWKQRLLRRRRTPMCG